MALCLIGKGQSLVKRMVHHWCLCKGPNKCSQRDFSALFPSWGEGNDDDDNDDDDDSDDQ